MKLKISLACCCIVFCLTLTARNPKKTADGGALDLKLVSYNVGVLDKYTPSTKIVSAILDELQVDFAGLQELDSCNLRHDTYQARDLAKAMKGRIHYHFTSAMPYRRGSYGVGVLSRRKILARYDIHLPKGDVAPPKGRNEPRAVCVVETADAVYASTHLCHRSSDTRLKQYAVLMDFFRSHRFDKPVILCGDFNARPEDPVIVRMLADWERISPLEFTIPSRKPRATIDYIFVLKNGYEVRVKEARVPMDFRKADVRMASDHLPVFVHAVFTKQGSPAE